ncbi:MAG: response regulator [Alphaproteobacteria bacterium]|nr:response regulator [Alphaproteobacteria bacterium]
MPEAKTRMRRLLVVDDQADWRRTIKDIARPLGWIVAEAANGRELKRCFDAIDPDFILLDMVMPEVDGFESLKWLAERSARARIAVMTGYAPHLAESAALVGNGLGASVVATLQKPVPIGRLRKLLETC